MQDLTAMIVRKAVRMAQQMGKKVVGVVESLARSVPVKKEKKAGSG